MKITRKRKILLSILLTIQIVAVSVLGIFLFAKTGDSVEFSKMIPVVHGAGGIDGLAYLNSQESFDLFVAKGYKYFEVDFIYTSDNILVCSHEFDHIENYNFRNRPTYDEFKNSIIAGKYHTITIPWLVEQVNKFSNIKIIFDTKESNKTQVLIDAYNKFKKLGLVTGKSLIAQIYWVDAYDQIKDLELNDIWFTNYKAGYTQQEISTHFDKYQDVTTCILSEENFLQFVDEGLCINKKIGVHYGERTYNKSLLQKHAVDYLFVNFWTELGDIN